MLNPDGVIIGNYRSSLSGCDLNRQWIAPLSKLYPEIHAVKQMMRKTLESRDIAFYCDFHGHSRARNAFMYGCQNPLTKDKRFRERVFPQLFGNRCEEFSYEGSAFNVYKAKESTARVVMWKEHALINSFTLECSFFGPTKGPLKDMHFNISTLLDLGRHFCETLAAYSQLTDEAHRRLLRDIEAQNVLPLASEDLLLLDEAVPKKAPLKGGQAKGSKGGSFMNLRNQKPFHRKPSVSTP